MVEKVYLNKRAIDLIQNEEITYSKELRENNNLMNVNHAKLMGLLFAKLNGITKM